MSTPVSSVMQRDVRSIDMDETVAQIEAFFAEYKLSWAPVVGDDDDVLGVISESDLIRLRTLLPNMASMCAWQLCTYRPVSVQADTPVEAVAQLMIERHIHHVAIVEHGRVAGVVSSLDLLRMLASRNAGE
jgi:CBS domain-containing protein